MSRVILSIWVLFTFSNSSFAAEVIKVKGQSALIDLKGDPAATGDLFYAVKPDGKRGAILKIGKVKGEKAIAKIIKGKAAVGYTLELKPADVTQKSKPSEGGGDSEDQASTRQYWGFLAGFAMDTMSANVNEYSTGLFLKKEDLRMDV